MLYIQYVLLIHIIHISGISHHNTNRLVSLSEN